MPFLTLFNSHFALRSFRSTIP